MEGAITDLPSRLNDPLEIDWVIHPEESIPLKLQKQFDRAQAQTAAEPDKDFKCLKPLSDFNPDTYTEKSIDKSQSQIEKSSSILNHSQIQRELNEKAEKPLDSKGKKEDQLNSVIELKEEEKIEEGVITNLPSRLNDPLEIDWVIHPEESIPLKLQKQFDRAQAQAAAEPDKDFKWLKPPSDFNPETHLEIVSGYEIGVCSFRGRRWHMEDTHLVSSFELSIQNQTYPVLLFGIFDGHAGIEAAEHVKNKLQSTLHQTLSEFASKGLTNGAIWNALKITCVKLKKTLEHLRAGTTAVFTVILDGKLWVANVGDSRAILDNGIQLSEDAIAENLDYHKGIQKRGCYIYANRINVILEPARAIGDRSTGNINARPKIIAYPFELIKAKGCLILACDGIYDVSSTRQIAEGVQTHPHEPADELAKTIVYSAFEAQSTDNLSVLIVKF